ncbi:MAG: MOSC domain-containing protein [Solirubrobacteraceae bacterium]
MPTAGAIRVTRLAVTPVKGLRLLSREAVVLDRAGVAEDRRFYVIDARGRMVNGKQLGALSSVVPGWDEASGTLTLTFPNGTAVSAAVELGAPIATRFHSRPATGRTVVGPWSRALSDHAGRALRLVAADGRVGVDRGRGGAVTLVSRASLDRLADVAGVPAIDARRFRMLVEVDGPAAHEEDGWVGRRLRVGSALVGVRGHVGRCLVTTRDPDTGEVDLPVLDLLRSYRADAPTTAPLAFGVYGEVLESGRVRRGDAVAVL